MTSHKAFYLLVYQLIMSWPFLVVHLVLDEYECTANDIYNWSYNYNIILTTTTKTTQKYKVRRFINTYIF